MFILLSFIEAHKIAIKVYSWDNASVQSNSPQPQIHHTTIKKSHPTLHCTIPHILLSPSFSLNILNYEWKLKCNMRLIKTLSIKSKRAKQQIEEREGGRRGEREGEKMRERGRRREERVGVS